MVHRAMCGLLMVTGGPGVVQEALKTRKRAITAGPGNPPVWSTRPPTSAGPA